VLSFVFVVTSRIYRACAFGVVGETEVSYALITLEYEKITPLSYIKVTKKVLSVFPGVELQAFRKQSNTR
jgi:hypothetical protein